ncbi:hypothetical protein AK830_g4796 [Neonectria ditissima]|uniref:Carboxylic ester hydrolase n=1 Tax=Neonectria ditissima TaxID=78410 RepID=A0A0P7B7E4_9HYPO|nr:hypothetical protein AK830_g4796 [Neonectria ditissima]
MASPSRPIGMFRDLMNKWPLSTASPTSASASTSPFTPNRTSSNINSNNKSLDAQRLIPGSLAGSDTSDTSSRISVSDHDSVSNNAALEPVKPNSRRKRIFLIGLSTVAALALVALGLGLYFGLKKERINLEDGPVVDLGYSRYQGKYLSNDVSQFLGVRYAQSPTGDLRWRAPVEPKKTKRIQSAQTFGSFCPGLYQKLGTGPDEDCLSANIWTKTNATEDMKLPVMVFMQGGGYTSNSNPHVNGSLIVETSEKNMVFVSFNFRVGLFGFLAGDDVRNDGDLNAGLLDQRFLLEWVQKHISKFGGDPEHVVIQGVSAGAGSVALHLAAYGGRDDGLFAGAIAESTFFPGQQDASDLEYQYNSVISEAHCEGADDKMACLRGKSANDLQNINHSGPFNGRTGLPNFYWAPCTDGDFLRDTAYNMYGRGDFVKVPILFGSCTNGILFSIQGSQFVPNAVDAEQFTNFMQNNYPGLTTKNTDAILEQYPLEDPLPTKEPWFPSTSRAYGEATFICPTNIILNAFRNANSSVTNATNIFSYRYNLQDHTAIAQGRGVPHVFEQPAVFGPSMTGSAHSYWTYNRAIVPVVMNYWISFVRTLDPNTHRFGNTPQWLPWGDTQRRLVLQLPKSSMETVSKNETARCDFWRGLNETMAQ